MPSFFDEYFPYWVNLQASQFAQVVNGGIDLLSGVKNFAPNEYATTHKGTPFYVMGLAAFLSHDYETATFLFDAALAEDLRSAPGKSDTPAMLFMQLDGENPHQLAKEAVTAIRTQAASLIGDYNDRDGSQALTLDEVRAVFLKYVIDAQQPQLRTVAATFISFVAEWHYRLLLINLIEGGARGPFFLHLFRGCLLLESLLKSNPKKTPKATTLGPILTELASELGIPELGVNQANRVRVTTTQTSKDNNFDAIVQALTRPTCRLRPQSNAL
jgi:hypothetical protein